MIKPFIIDYIPLSDEDFNDFAPIIFGFDRLKNIIYRGAFLKLSTEQQQFYIDIFKEVASQYCALIDAVADQYSFSPEKQGLILDTCNKSLDIIPLK